MGAVEAVGIAVDAYIYGYPLVTFDMVRKQQTNVVAPDAEHAPMGQMIKMRTYPAVDNHCCAAPNADTLYTEVWLDVSSEPHARRRRPHERRRPASVRLAAFAQPTTAPSARRQHPDRNSTDTETPYVAALQPCWLWRRAPRRHRQRE